MIAKPPNIARLSAKTLGGRKIFYAGRQLRTLACLAVTIVACERHRMRCVYEVPEGFRGWVLIEHDRPECPPVPVEDGKRIYRIPSSGRLCVRDSIEYGRFAKDEYYFVGSDRRPIPLESPGHDGLVRGEGVGGPEGHTFDHFFVGTEKELEAQPFIRLFEHVQAETRPPA